MTRRGITVLEILVVLAIAVFALGLMVVLIARHRENAQRMQCKNNLRLIGQAFQAYHDASSADKALKRLPPSHIAEGYATWAVLLATSKRSWRSFRKSCRPPPSSFFVVKS